MYRYFAFAGDRYYPGMGMADFIGDFEELEEARAAVDEKIKEEPLMWGLVWDSVYKEYVYQTGYL